MQVFGLPGHIIRKAGAASRLLAAQSQISKPGEDATLWRDGWRRAPTASIASRRRGLSALPARRSGAGATTRRPRAAGRIA